jgi:hypothetical protein
VLVLASLGLVALGLVIGFRAGIHWERVGRKVDMLAKTESVPAAQDATAEFELALGQQQAHKADAPAGDDSRRAAPGS